jgi:hypothetical protein
VLSDEDVMKKVMEGEIAYFGLGFEALPLLTRVSRLTDKTSTNFRWSQALTASARYSICFAERGMVA